MAAKTIQLSIDAGTTYYSFPGSSGDFSDNAGSLDDTIFGQDVKSSQSNLVDWAVTSDAVYKGYAGYNVTVKQQGTSTTMTAEAMTNVSGKIYQITNYAVKGLWDSTQAITVLDNAVDHTADVLSIDYLTGTVTFKAAYTPTTPITVTGHYLPLAALAKYQKYQLKQSQAVIDNTDIPTAQGNSGQRTYAYGLKTFQLTVDGVYPNAAPVYRTALLARSQVVLEICPDGGSKSVFRGFFKPSARKQSGKVGALEMETVTYDLTVPANAQLAKAATWVFTSSDLSTSVQNALTAFLNETTCNVKYLPDGGTTSNAGLTGQCLISDISLSGGIDAMNTFAITMQGTGAATAV